MGRNAVDDRLGPLYCYKSCPSYRLIDAHRASCDRYLVYMKDSPFRDAHAPLNSKYRFV